MATLSQLVTPNNLTTATNTQTLTNKTLQAPNITTGLTLSGAAGTAGQTLLSGGAGAAPTWGAVRSNIKNDLVAYDATLSLGSTLGGDMYGMHCVQLTSSTELVLVWGQASLHAVVWNDATKTFGPPVLVRTAALTGARDVAAVGISSTSVLVCSLPQTGTALETVVLSVSGTTVTVNTAVATTLATTASLAGRAESMGMGVLFAVGSSYVLSHKDASTATAYYRAITVSGTTPTVGSQLSFTAGTNSHQYANLVLDGTKFLHVSASATLLYAVPVSVSGTTLTQGTQATTTASANTIKAGALSTGRIAVAYSNSNISGAIINVSGTTATISAVALDATNTSSIHMQVLGSQAWVLRANGSGAIINVLTDNAGTAVAGTAITNPAGTSVQWRIAGFNGTQLFVQSGAQATDFSEHMVFGISGNNPSLVARHPSIMRFPGSTDYFAVSPEISYPVNTPYANLESAKVLRVGTKHAQLGNGENANRAAQITQSYDGTGLPVPQTTVSFVVSGGNGAIHTRSALNLSSGWLPAHYSSTPSTVLLRRIELT